MQIPAQNNEHVKHIQKKRAPHIGYGKKFTDSQIIKHNECWKFHACSWISSFCYFQRLVYGLNRHVDIEFKKWFPRSLSPDNQWNRTIASDTSVLLRWPRVSRSIPSTCARNLWLGPLQKVPGMSLGWWCIGSDRIFFQILNTQDGLFSFPMTLWLDKAKHKITGTYCMFTCYVYAIGFADCSCSFIKPLLKLKL